MLQPAPYFSDVADGPEGQAYWLTCADEVRIRIGHWPLEGAKGTILMFPGRTEYIEKYGRAARDFAANGYSSVAIDWRGQGIAQRILPERRVGYVGKFQDYQKDIAALQAALPELGVTGPLLLLAHSMGGCIGLRALHEHLPVNAVVFSAPMWGIDMSTLMRPVAWVVSAVSHWFGLQNRFAPGTGSETYVVSGTFEDNTLTRDPDMFDYMRQQVKNYPDLALGGPSLHWLFEALLEMRALRKMPPPDLPCIAVMGTHERIVDRRAIKNLMARWQNAVLRDYDGAEHEIIMETPDVRQDFINLAVSLFDKNLQTATDVKLAAE